MSEAQPGSDPRWGQQDRDKKAEAILRTVQRCTKADVTRGAWLDVGCGSGGVAATLAQHVERVVGIDPEAWDRWHKFRADHPNLDLRQGSYRDLQTLLPAGSIDVVVCNQVYEHVDDPIALLGQIHRVLKPGGVCYFAGPNLLWPVEPHVFWPFVHWLPRDFAIRLMTVCHARHAHALDAWSWPYWKLTRSFRDAGFRYAVAVRERLGAQAEAGGSRMLGMAARIPAPVVTALIPFAPAFIFVLTKPAAVE